MLSLDRVILGVPDVHAARDFYSTVLAAGVEDHDTAVDLDLHGAGHLALVRVDSLAEESRTDPTGCGFRGFVLSYVVEQPTEVATVHRAAETGGASSLKPAKKGFFGGFTGVFRAPDGAVWKPAAGSRKDTGPSSTPPRPTECGVILGVADPKASRDFYTALGMSTDRDYGTKFIDFTVASGGWRLGLMTRSALAKDAGVKPAGAGSAAVTLHHEVGSGDEVDALMAVAVSAGGTAAVPASRTERGDYAGRFSDPDGFLWEVASRS